MRDALLKTTYVITAQNKISQVMQIREKSVHQSCIWQAGLDTTPYVPIAGISVTVYYVCTVMLMPAMGSQGVVSSP